MTVYFYNFITNSIQHNYSWCPPIKITVDINNYTSPVLYLLMHTVRSAPYNYKLLQTEECIASHTYPPVSVPSRYSLSQHLMWGIDAKWLTQ